jgi:hypothetical protein
VAPGLPIRRALPVGSGTAPRLAIARIAPAAGRTFLRENLTSTHYLRGLALFIQPACDLFVRRFHDHLYLTDSVPSLGRHDPFLVPREVTVPGPEFHLRRIADLTLWHHPAVRPGLVDPRPTGDRQLRHLGVGPGFT